MSKVVRIESRHNPKLKLWREALHSPAQSPLGWIGVETPRSIEQLAADRPIELLLYAARPQDPTPRLATRARESVALAPPLFKRLSTVERPQGMIAFFEAPSFDWGQMPDRLLYLDQVRDPGNLGTLLRTASATGQFGLVSSPGSVAFGNPKVVRASASALFDVPHLAGVEADELIARGYRLYTASAGGTISLFDVQFEEPFAIVLGNEGEGVRPEIAEQARARVRVPMEPGCESLNVSVTGALFLYEVYRR